MKKISFFFLPLGILLSIFILFPKPIFAEIATTRDWIGLFYTTETGHLKANTVNGDSWVYTSSCTKTRGTIPYLARSGIPSPCVITITSPTPTPGWYVFRMYANNEESLDARIAEKQVLRAGPSATPTPPPAVGKLYRITGDLTINSDITVNTIGVFFVEGNLYIRKDLTNTNPKTGIVFVVKGSIYIDRDVTTVNAFLIAHGKDASGNDITPFCSAYNKLDTTTPPACLDYLDADILSRKTLTINGSVISLNSTLAPQFIRKNAPDAITPAETINYEAKYLIIMKDVFSRDLKIWKEIQ